MYATRNFRTKKAFREAVERGERVTVFQPGRLFPALREGCGTVEGPHAPEPHRWYAEVELREGVVVKVK